MINDLIKMLRSKAIEMNTTADSLERMKGVLFPNGINHRENANTARAILKRKGIDEMSIGKSPMIIANSKLSKVILDDILAKGFDNEAKKKTHSYKGKHWTQLPENAAKLKRVIRKMIKGKKESRQLNQPTK